jgi:Domain of unknown function (DUF4292)
MRTRQRPAGLIHGPGPAPYLHIDPSIGMKTIRTISTRLAALLAIAAIASLTGCSSSSRTVTAQPGGTGAPPAADDARSISVAEEVLTALRASYASTPMLTLNGDMKIAGAGITVWYDALMRGRDSLRINLVGPFGVPVGSLSATPAEFLFFNAQEGEAIEGAPDRETFGKLMQLNMDYDEMASMLRGELPRIPAAGTYKAEERDGVMHYTVTNSLVTERFAVRMEDLAVESFSRVIPNAGEPFEELAITYKDFYKVEGRQFPKKVYVAIANGEQKVTVTVDKVRSSIAKDRSCSLQLPPGIERRRL